MTVEVLVLDGVEEVAVGVEVVEETTMGTEVGVEAEAMGGKETREDPPGETQAGWAYCTGRRTRLSGVRM